MTPELRFRVLLGDGIPNVHFERALGVPQARWSLIAGGYNTPASATIVAGMVMPGMVDPGLSLWKRSPTPSRIASMRSGGMLPAWYEWNTSRTSLRLYSRYSSG
jgi:hypothetical protein